MNANELFEQLKGDVFELLDKGEMTVVFGEYITDTFNVYITSENELEVEYKGRSLRILCNDFENTEYVARLIMHCFAKLYLNK